MCSAGGRRSYGTHTGSSAMKITTGPLVTKNALRETTVLATSPASLMGKKPVCRDGRENTAKNQSVLKAAMKGTETAHYLESANAERAGRVSFVMCVNFIRPVNTVPVKRLGSAIAKKAGGASSVTKT